MKNNDLTLFFQQELRMYQSDPLWFKKALLNACTRDADGSIGHIEYVDDIFFFLLVATMLKYIRPIVPDSLFPYDLELDESFGSINKFSCVVLLRNSDGRFIEPITGIKIDIPGLGNYSASEIYEQTIAFDRKMVLASGNDNIPPIAYVTDDILSYWEETTVPYKKELFDYLNLVASKTMDNFSLNYVSENKIKERIAKAIK